MLLSTLPTSHAAGLDQNVITARLLCKSYRHQLRALQQVDLTVKQGELFGLVGPDGAGKSTLLKILSGIMEASSGEVLICGHPPSKVRAQLGYVSQNLSLYKDLTVDETLFYEAGIRGVDGHVFARRREYYLQKMGLRNFSSRLVGALSGGMKQKLSLCCALIAEPQVLLLDEPTEGLDPLFRRELWQLLAGLARQGVTIVVATPSFEDAEHCDRVALVHTGQIIACGKIDELQSQLHLRRLLAIVSDSVRSQHILHQLRQKHHSGIISTQVFGDGLEILITDDNATEEEIRLLLLSEHLSPAAVHTHKPTLENVFLMKLQDDTIERQEMPPFPRTVHTFDRQSAGTVAIAACRVCKQFGNYRAVNDIELTLEYGQIYGLLGANGAGKTTTIRMLCGLLSPTSGQILLNGQPHQMNCKESCRQLGYMSQNFTLYDSLTAVENLQFYAAIYQVPRSQRIEKIDWALNVLGISHLENTPVCHLPRGWKQRIAFGAALLHEPDILILDEPTAGVDPAARRTIWSIIREFALRGTAVLVSTHHMQEAEYCQQLSLMMNGQIVVQDSPLAIRRALTGKVFELKGPEPQPILDALKNHLECWRVCLVNGNLRLILNNPQADLDRLQSALRENGLTGFNFTSVPPSLEEAFTTAIQQ